MKNKIIIKDASEIVTCSGFEAKKGKEMQDIAVIYDGAIVETFKQGEADENTIGLLMAGGKRNEQSS